MYQVTRELIQDLAKGIITNFKIVKGFTYYLVILKEEVYGYRSFVIKEPKTTDYWEMKLQFENHKFGLTQDVYTIYPICCKLKPKGRVAEWSIAAVLKTVSPKGDVGSNPTPSAINYNIRN